MTDEDIARLRALAQAATPGPWVGMNPCFREYYVYAPSARYNVPWAGDSHVKVAWVPWEPGENRSRNDTAYIAAASPDVVLALLDEIERLRGCDQNSFSSHKSP